METNISCKLKNDETMLITDCSIMYTTGPIIVGYEFVVYTTDETAGMVQICAIIYEPMTGGAPRDFVVLSTTRDGSASKRLSVR